MGREIHLRIFDPDTNAAVLSTAQTLPDVGPAVLAYGADPATDFGDSGDAMKDTEPQVMGGIFSAASGAVQESPLLQRINDTIAKLKVQRASATDIGAALKRIIHSPAVALLVALTPNTADDAVLELLKGMFPQAA